MTAAPGANAAIRDALRQGTHAAHARLDGLWTDRDLADPAVYPAFLRSIAAALVPLERGLSDAGVAALMPDWHRRQRSPHILDDLAGLATALPIMTPVSLAAGAEMFGILYVLEGSRLGGAVLARQVGASTDPLVLGNRRFLLQGQGMGLWRSFLEQLEHAAPSPAMLERICQCAADAFALFEHAALREIDRLGKPGQDHAPIRRSANV